QRRRPRLPRDRGPGAGAAGGAACRVRVGRRHPRCDRRRPPQGPGRRPATRGTSPGGARMTLARRWSARLAAFAIVAASASFGALPAIAQSRATVSTTTEAWYNVTPASSSGDLGLPPVSPYAAHTLHVGITAGNEDARTYLALDVRD